MGTQTDSYVETPSSSVILTFGQLWQIPTFFLGLAILGTVWAARPYWYDPDGLRFQRELSTARHAIESGSGVQEATQLLLNAFAQVDQHQQSKDELLFLLGSAYVRLAESANSQRARDLWLQALHNFDQVQPTAIADADALTLIFQAARARFFADDNPEALKKVIVDLTLCADRMPERRWVAYDILTQAYLKSNPPDRKAALLANEHQLQLPVQDERFLDPVRLLRGELLLKNGEREEARLTLARIGRQAPATLLQRALYLRAQSYQDDKVWVEAAGLWKEILADSRLPVPEQRHVLYCLGVCYQNLNNSAEAERFWEQTITQGGEEAVAAQIYMAELRIQAKRFDDAVQIFEKALAGVEKPEDYKEGLIPITRIAANLETACLGAEKAGALSDACRLAKLYSRVAPRENGLKLVARTAEAKANASNDIKDFREAGLAYEAAAAMNSGRPQELPLLSLAAKNMIAAKDFKYAIDIIGHYILLKPPMDSLSEAYYHLGEAQAALAETTPPTIEQNQIPDAEKSWREGYGRPGAFANKSGIKLALSLQQRNKFAEAESILEKIADQTNSDENQEDAMFALANIYFVQGSYRRASQRWSQAFNAYRTSRWAFEARYHWGESYRRMADAEEPNTSPGFPRHDRDRIKQSHNTLLESAAAQFKILSEDLQAKREGGAKLTEAEADLLRESLFALAECHFDHAQYELARPIYERLAADYGDRVEGLGALKLLYHSYIANNPPNLEKAAESLDLIERALNNLPDLAFTGLQSRKAYEKWLSDQRVELDKLKSYLVPKK